MKVYYACTIEETMVYSVVRTMCEVFRCDAEMLRDYMMQII